MQRGVQLRSQNPHAAFDFTFFDTAQGQRDALAGGATIRRGILHAQAAHTHRFARRRELQLIANTNLAGESGAGDDGTDAAQGEAAVDS